MVFRRVLLFLLTFVVVGVPAQQHLVSSASSSSLPPPEPPQEPLQAVAETKTSKRTSASSAPEPHVVVAKSTKKITVRGTRAAVVAFVNKLHVLSSRRERRIRRRRRRLNEPISKGATARLGRTLKTGGANKSENSSKGRREPEEEDPAYLIVQMARDCSLHRNRDGSYEFKSPDMDEQTYFFSNRPFRHEVTMETSKFVAGYDTTFSEETGGPPNAALTMMHEKDGKFEGPVVTVLSKAVYADVEGNYVYEMEQTPEQAAVLSLEEVMKEATDEVYEYCSLFVDFPNAGPFRY